MAAFPCMTCNASPCCCHATFNKTTTTAFPCMTCNSDLCCCNATFNKHNITAFPCKTCNAFPCCCNATFNTISNPAMAAFPCKTCNASPCCCNATFDPAVLATDAYPALPLTKPAYSGGMCVDGGDDDGYDGDVEDAFEGVTGFAF